MAWETIERIEPSPIHEAGLRLTLEWDLPVHVTWSLDGAGLYLVLWKLGFYYLDLGGMALQRIQDWKRRLWGRPTVSGDRILLPALHSGSRWLARNGEYWDERAGFDPPGWALVPEWLPEGTAKIPAVCQQVGAREWSLLELDETGACIRELRPALATGEELRIDLGYPCWYEPGRSMLVTGGPVGWLKPFVVDLETEEASELQLDAPEGLHRFSRASAAPVLAGYAQGPFYPSDLPFEVTVRVVDLGGRVVFDRGMVEPHDAFFETVAISPQGDRVALIDQEGRIHLVPGLERDAAAG